MKQVVIDNPVLNSPYVEPSRHFKFDDDGITDKIVAQRRISSYFIPIARTKTTVHNAVDAIRHQDKRLNIPTEELRDFVAPDEATPKSGKIAVKVINHFGDEVLKVYKVKV